ncbi:hypothetical protein ROHU_034288 [Labeo rohita]|uniref:Uncharacterized protein n=1 Tax=Labeo rohita TaxID=84645 RepID=A0A498LBT0_LABRO|nr:hypothetical protein ROHU_034288 [Labeo rohita]
MSASSEPVNRSVRPKRHPAYLQDYEVDLQSFHKSASPVVTREQAVESSDDDFYSSQTSNIIRHRQDAALRGLPIFLREEPGKLFKQCLETDPHDVAVKGVAVGVLYVLEDCAVETSSPKVQNISLIVEESVVLQDIADTLYDLLQELGATKEKLQSTETRLKALETSQQELMSKHANSKAQIDKIKKENKDLLQERRATKEKLQSTETRLKALETSQQELMSKHANSEAQIDKIKMEKQGVPAFQRMCKDIQRLDCTALAT